MDTILDSLLLPPALQTEVEALAAEEHRPAVDVLRELVERGLEARRWKAYLEADAGGSAQLPSDEYRQVLRDKIARGMKSLRDGEGADGEAFMARMDAELAELEQQGR